MTKPVFGGRNRKGLRSRDPDRRLFLAILVRIPVYQHWYPGKLREHQRLGKINFLEPIVQHHFTCSISMIAFFIASNTIVLSSADGTYLANFTKSLSRNACKSFSNCSFEIWIPLNWITRSSVVFCSE